VGLGACRRLRKCWARSMIDPSSGRLAFGSRLRRLGRPVAVHVEREGGHSPKPPADWSSRSPRTALFPDGRHTPDEHHCASAGHRLATIGRRQGSRVPIYSAIERSVDAGMGGGLGGWVGRNPCVSLSQRRVVECDSRVERSHATRAVWSLPSDQHLRRAPAGAPALLQITHCDGRRRRPSQPRVARTGHPGGWGRRSGKLADAREARLDEEVEGAQEGHALVR
jgi:hypothetical protein